MSKKTQNWAVPLIAVLLGMLVGAVLMLIFGYAQSAHRYFPDAPAVPSFSCSVPVQTAAFCPDTYILRPRNCSN